MRFLLTRIAKLNIGWNERVLGEGDAFRLAERLGIEVQIVPMTVDGFYFRVMEREFIRVNKNLPRPQRLKVLFHELAHQLFHAPTSGPAVGFHRVGKRNRQEIEADTFAICALLPRCVFECRSIDDLIDGGFELEMILERAAIMRRYAI